MATHDLKFIVGLVVDLSPMKVCLIPPSGYDFFHLRCKPRAALHCSYTTVSKAVSHSIEYDLNDGTQREAAYTL